MEWGNSSNSYLSVFPIQNNISNHSKKDVCNCRTKGIIAGSVYSVKDSQKDSAISGIQSTFTLYHGDYSYDNISAQT